MKRYFLALLGLILFSSGLCIFGEAVISKYENTNWFCVGTVSLILINAGLGLMIKNKDPYLIEYNVRMGDPECQVIMPRLKTDLFKIISYSLKNQIKRLKLKWEINKCMTIVLCSKGYPGNYKKEKIISRVLDDLVTSNTCINFTTAY